MTNVEEPSPAKMVDFEAIFGATTTPLLVLTPDLQIVGANSAYERATMTERANLVGRNFSDVFPDNPDDPETTGSRNLRASFQRALSSRQPDPIPVQKYDIPRPEADGGGFEEKYWSAINTPVLVDGQVRYLIHSAIDVTATVKLQQQGAQQSLLTEELSARQLELVAEVEMWTRQASDSSRELKESNSELSRLYEEGVELDRLKSDFFANVSHELRTPLALILGRADRLKDDGYDTAGLSADAASIRNNAHVLLQQVNNLLEAATFDRGAAVVERRRFDIASMTRAQAANFESAMLDADIRLEVNVPSEPIEIDADPNQIASALGNLLANACKFTPAGGLVKCSLLVDADAIGLEVVDTGPGISPEMRSVVFERFRQADSGASRRFGGTGLGLSIVKDIVELHGGSVSVTDAANGGACFRISLPKLVDDGNGEHSGKLDEDWEVSGALPTAASEAAAASRRISATPRPTPQNKVPEGSPVLLLVEDNQDLAAFVAEELGPQYEIHFAGDGIEALDVLGQRRVDLVLSDVMMPRMDGAELLNRIRSNPKLTDIPVIILTARTDPDARQKLLESGATDFLSKPFSSAELAARVRNISDASLMRNQREASLSRRTEELAKANQRLVELASRDELTGLPNGAQLVGRLDQMLGDVGATEEVAVALINVEGVDRIASTIGHSVGDTVVIECANRLSDLTGPDQLLARLDSNRFALAASSGEALAALVANSQRMINALGKPIRIREESVVLPATVGIASDRDTSADVLIRKAELAAGRARAEGRNQVRVFNPAFQAEATERLELESGLRQALVGHGLELHYQPEYALASGQLRGFEALIRWQRAPGPLTSPAAFLPVAQAAGLMTEVDRWVIASACRQAFHWRDELASAGARVWINISAQMLQDRDLPKLVTSACEQAGIPNRSLGIEISETFAMDASLDTRHFYSLVDADFELAIDDFGTGYSSLGRLRELPVSVLKLDRSLIANLDKEPGMSSIAEAAIVMAHTLGLEVLAEGIERQAEVEHLVDLRCDIGQGYHLGRPAPADEARF